MSKAMTLEDRVDAYIKLRDYVEAQQARIDEQLKPYRDAMAKLQATMLDLMHTQGVQNVKTPAGTAYRTLRSSVTVRDWDVALEFIRSNELWHMLERRISSARCEEFVEENKRPFPGCDMSRAWTVQIRRS